MASPSAGKKLPPRQPTTFYFAYGSNLHLKQMKRRCPNSLYIGTARLVNYRWQINERGYANVVKAHGYWVDGLVYEINGADEAKLDINEGVSKNAYSKRTLKAQLFRAPSSLYRRPTSWIVDRGGPAKVCREAREEGYPLKEPVQHWVQDVLVYISYIHIADSIPKDEYINRINYGLVDAKALGIEQNYISNCIRPFIPIPARNRPAGGGGAGGGAQKKRNNANGDTNTNNPNTTTNNTPNNTSANANPNLRPSGGTRGVKRNASPRTGERSPARKAQPPPQQSQPQSQPRRTEEHRQPQQQQTLQPPPLPPRSRSRSEPLPRRPVVVSTAADPPPLPPRPVNRFRDAPIIVVEEFHYSSRSF